MIRTRKIIGKSQIFDYVGNPEIAKLEILTSKQNTIKNKEVCSVYIYHRVNFTDVCTIIGKCKIFSQTKKSDKNYPVYVKHHGIVTGLCSSLAAGFISACNINKLLKVQKETGFDFNISKKIKALCQ